MAVMEEGSEQLQAIRYRRGRLELLDQVGFMAVFGFCLVFPIIFGNFGWFGIERV